jgi:hypothetical protein
LTLKGDSTAESHARKFLAKSFCFGRMFRFLETVSEFEERCSPLFIGHDRIRQEIDDGTIPGNVPTHRDGINLLSHLGGERNAPSDAFRSCESRIHVHQNTPIYTKLQSCLSPNWPDLLLPAYYPGLQPRGKLLSRHSGIELAEHCAGQSALLTRKTVV